MLRDTVAYELANIMIWWAVVVRSSLTCSFEFCIALYASPTKNYFVLVRARLWLRDAPPFLNEVHMFVGVISSDVARVRIILICGLSREVLASHLLRKKLFSLGGNGAFFVRCFF